MSGPALIGLPVAAELAARALDAHADFRVLRRLRPMLRTMTGGLKSGMMTGCALDVETTGLDHRGDAVIELALQTFVMDALGRIVMVGRPRSWLEQPPQPITAEITRLTGISDADVEGRRIADGEATCVIADSHFVLAHNAGFDRPFVERRLPGAAGKPWVCSLNDVDWRGLGFEGRSLSQLLCGMGWFYDAHRASTDVTALLRLLDHEVEGRGSVLSIAVEAAMRPTWSIEAVGAPFAAKDVLKGRGYRWDAEARLWSRQVGLPEFDDEIAWATLEVYGGMSKPRFRQVTWLERYAAVPEVPSAAGFERSRR